MNQNLPRFIKLPFKRSLQIVINAFLEVIQAYYALCNGILSSKSEMLPSFA
jgi:hypothetical protein